MIKTYAFHLEFTPNKNGQPYFAPFPFIFDGAALAGIFCGVSSRFAGDMVYDANNPARLALFASLGLNPLQVFGLHQIHSRKVLEIDPRNAPFKAAPGSAALAAAEADGLISAGGPPQTAAGAAVLSVTVADCLPVYLYDTESGAYALVHSGWKGTGIVRKALKLMGERWHTRPEAVAAILGPCIDACCYQVDEERAIFFEKEFSATPAGLSPADAALLKPVVRRDSTGCYLNLKAANLRLLAGSGVQNIAVCGNCTFTDERLGSFRREGGQYTRMAALIWKHTTPSAKGNYIRGLIPLSTNKE